MEVLYETSRRILKRQGRIPLLSPALNFLEFGCDGWRPGSHIPQVRRGAALWGGTELVRDDGRAGVGPGLL